MTTTRREPIDRRIRRCVERLAVDLELRAILDPEQTRNVNGTQLAAGEFLQREAVRSVPNLGRNEGRARRVIAEMVADGAIELARTVPRGRHPWRIYRLASRVTGARVAQPRRVSLVKFDPWAPMPDWLALELEGVDPDEEPQTRGEARERRRLDDLDRLRYWWPGLPDDAPQRLMNILDHEPPAWLDEAAYRRWHRRRTDAGVEGRVPRRTR